MKLNRQKTYQVLRVYEDTKNCNQGEHYTIVFAHPHGWQVWENSEVLYSASHTCFENPKYWEIDFAYEDQEEALYAQHEKEYKAMSFDKVKQEALVIEMGVIMVNGSRLDKFTDEALISMVKAERKKLAILSDEIGAGSKYYQAKKVGMEANVAILLDALDSRVDS